MINANEARVQSLMSQDRICGKKLAWQIKKIEKGILSNIKRGHTHVLVYFCAGALKYTNLDIRGHFVKLGYECEMHVNGLDYDDYVKIMWKQ